MKTKQLSFDKTQVKLLKNETVANILTSESLVNEFKIHVRRQF